MELSLEKERCARFARARLSPALADPREALAASDYHARAFGLDRRKTHHLSVARQSDNSLFMNPRHAAALALVGWYFIMPPTRTSPKGIVNMDIKAPLSRWQIVGRFDSTKDCNESPDQLRKMQRETENPNISPVENRNEEGAMNILLAKSQCIASDDPRLKEK